MTTTNGSSTSVRRTSRTKLTSGALDDVKARVKKNSDTDPKTKEAAKTRRSVVKKESSEMSVEKATAIIATTKVKVTQTFDAMNEALNEKLEELRLVNEAIDVARSELQELHDNDVVLSSTAELIEQHEQKKKELQEEIVTIRAAWEREQEIHEEALAERDRDLSKQRQREADEYNFNLGIKRRNEEAAFNERVRALRMREQERQELFEKDLKVREEAMAAKEQEFESLKAKAERFDEDVKTAAAEQANSVIKAVTREHKNELERVQMQAEADKRVLQLELDNMRNQFTNKADQVSQLQAELKAAHEKVSTLATAALDASSSKQTLEQLSRLQQNQSQNKK